MQAAEFSETPVHFYQTTLWHNPEDSKLYIPFGFFFLLLHHYGQGIWQREGASWFSAGRLEGKITLGTPRRKLQDNIKMHPQQGGWGRHGLD